MRKWPRQRNHTIKSNEPSPVIVFIKCNWIRALCLAFVSRGTGCNTQTGHASCGSHTATSPNDIAFPLSRPRLMLGSVMQTSMRTRSSLESLASPQMVPSNSFKFSESVWRYRTTYERAPTVLKSFRLSRSSPIAKRRSSLTQETIENPFVKRSANFSRLILHEFNCSLASFTLVTM